MTICVGVEHHLETENSWDESSSIDDDLAKHVYRVQARAGQPIRLVKHVVYHTSRGVPVRELADRCDRTLDRAHAENIDETFEKQRVWLDDYWARSDVEIAGQPAIQQAVRWNLFMLAQATARTDGHGIAAKGVTGSGYGGHYLGHGDLRPAVPVLHGADRRPERPALPLQHARRGTLTGT